MARNVETAHTFTKEQKFQLDKEITVVRCDDGTVYEFSDVQDSPEPPRLRKGIQPDGSLTHTDETAAVLPSAVEETAETIFGGWTK